MSDIKVMVIGAGGFLGINLCRALSEHGIAVHCFSRTRPPEAAAAAAVQWTIGDLADEACLAQALRGKELIFHLASTTSPAQSNSDPAKDLAENVSGTIRLLQACVREGVRKVVFASSGGTVYGIPALLPIAESAPTNPLAAYGISKLGIEKYLYLFRHLHNLDYQVLRISNPYGPHQSPLKPQGLVANVMHRGLRGEPIEVYGDGAMVRDYVYVDDVARAFIFSADYNGDEKIMNVGSGTGRSITEVIDHVEQALGMGKLVIKHGPARKADVPVNVLDTALIERETGWRPRVDFVDGLERTAAWMRTMYA